MIFTGIKWNNVDKSPYFSYKNHFDSPIIQKKMQTGVYISIEVGDIKYCTGYFSHPDYTLHSCLNQGMLSDYSLTQCSLCRNKDATYFMPFDVLSFDQISILKQQPHLNYINIFGKDIIKTGVAAAVRKYTRVLEQGAFATIFFTSCDGFTARQIEQYVSKTLNLKQSVTWESKVKGINEVPNKEDLYKRLSHIYKEIADIISNSHREYFFSDPEFCYNYDLYRIESPDKFKSFILIDHISPGETFSGTVVGIYGDIMILKDDLGDIYGINTKALIGYQIKISTSHADFKLLNKNKIINFQEKIKQISLF